LGWGASAVANFAGELELLDSGTNRGRRGGRWRWGVLTTRVASSCANSYLSMTTEAAAWRRALTRHWREADGGEQAPAWQQLVALLFTPDKTTYAHSFS